MASWVLKCPNCNSDFANSPIKEDTLAEFFLREQAAVSKRRENA
jgi:hypothetical protein